VSREHFAKVVAEARRLGTAAGAITCPTLIVRGAESEVFSPEEAAEFARLLDNGRWLSVEDAAHNVQGDNPRGLLDVLRPFLAETAAS
jgi:pimeloyl-ACP methyl ester carboxylesterase